MWQRFTERARRVVFFAQEEAARLGAVSVATIHVRIGPLSGVVPTALAAAFDLAVRGTQMDGARLNLEHDPITAWCRICKAVQVLQDPWSRVCPACELPLPELLSGDRLELTALEIVDGESPNC